MARTDTLGHFLTDVADAIRTKTGSSDTIAAEDFDTEIENIPSSGGGGDLSEYFITEITPSTTTPITNALKKHSDIIVSDNVTSLQSAFSDLNGNGIAAPKIVCNNNVTSLAWMFYNLTNCTSVDLSGIDSSNVTTMQGLLYAQRYDGSLTTVICGNNFDTRKVENMRELFYLRSGLTSLDLSSFDTPALTNTYRMFSGCTHLMFIDMRNMTFTNITYSLDMFGAGANAVPDNCEIIVKDQTQKNWITTNFSRLTNVKTVEEYEAEQNQ
jgi:surface protein